MTTTVNRSRVVAAMLQAINSTSAAGIPVARRINFLEQQQGTDSIVVYTDTETITTQQYSQTRSLTVKVLAVKSFQTDSGRDSEQNVEDMVTHIESNLRTGVLSDVDGNVGKIELKSIEWDVNSGEKFVAIATLTYVVTYATAYM